MAAPQGIVRVHQQQQTIAFQVEGWTTMHQSLAFRRAAEYWLEQGACVMRVDLSRCTFMDSTFIGTLLNLKRAVNREENGDFALVGPTAACLKLFQQMGLDGVFPILAVDEAAGFCWTEMPCEKTDDFAFKCNVVEAHQGLADLGGRAGEIFRPVARCLSQEMEAAKKAGAIASSQD
jgi:anti-anti-sigma factor